MKLDRKFKNEFSHGVGFWTGEDGMLVALVIQRGPDAVDRLRQNFAHVFHQKGFDFEPKRLRKAYVKREWAEREWFFERGSKGKLWTECKEKTPFPVLVYDLYPDDEQKGTV